MFHSYSSLFCKGSKEVRSTRLLIYFVEHIFQDKLQETVPIARSVNTVSVRKS